MNNTYMITIDEEGLTRKHFIMGAEAAFEAYKATVAYVEAVGIEADVNMIDMYTGEILCTTHEFGIYIEEEN